MRQSLERSNHTTIYWISEVAGRKKIYIIILLLIQALLGVSGVFFAVVLSHLVDGAVSGDNVKFRYAAVGFILLVAGQIILRAVNRYLEESAKASLENSFKERLYENLFQREYARVTATHSGEWVNRLTSDTQVVADAMAQIVPGITGMMVKMFGALIAILYYLPSFGYLLIPGGVILILLTYVFRSKLKILHKKVQEADGGLRVFLQESIESMMVVRAYGKESETFLQMADKMEVHKKSRLNRMKFSNICNIGFGAAMQGAYVLGAIVCGYGILIGTMSYGNLMAVMQLIGQIQTPFANITGYLPKFYAMLASAERLMEIEVYEMGMDMEDYHSLEDIQQFYQNELKAICMEEGEFCYKTFGEENAQRPITLHDIDLRINKGEYIALMGPSGCGKSTILKVLLSLYKLEKGQLYMETNKKCNIELTAKYRKLFAYVPQGNALMSGNLREVVTFADASGMRNEEDIWRALTIACADVFVKELPEGLDTVLGERGIGMSEGQMQRIAIARAIYSGNPILLFDESTSALDEQTEAKLLSNLRNLTDKTVIIVTHRPAALKICDKIVQL